MPAPDYATITAISLEVESHRIIAYCRTAFFSPTEQAGGY